MKKVEINKDIFDKLVGANGNQEEFKKILNEHEPALTFSQDVFKGFGVTKLNPRNFLSDKNRKRNTIETLSRLAKANPEMPFDIEPELLNVMSEEERKSLQFELDADKKADSSKEITDKSPVEESIKDTDFPIRSMKIKVRKETPKMLAIKDITPEEYEKKGIVSTSEKITTVTPEEVVPEASEKKEELVSTLTPELELSSTPVSKKTVEFSGEDSKKFYDAALSSSITEDGEIDLRAARETFVKQFVEPAKTHGKDDKQIAIIENAAGKVFDMTSGFYGGLPSTDPKNEGKNINSDDALKRSWTALITYVVTLGLGYIFDKAFNISDSEKAIKVQGNLEKINNSFVKFKEAKSQTEAVEFQDKGPSM